jgi:hypothetical protein
MIYYVSEIIESIPVDIDEIEKQKLTSFTPISILPSSNRSINLILGEVLYNSKMDINSNDAYYMEAFYQKNPKGKWTFIDKFLLYNKGYLKPETKKNILFAVVDYDSTRQKLVDSVPHQETDLYQGAFSKNVEINIKKYSYQFFKYPLLRIRDIFISILFYPNLFKNYILNKFIRIPFIVKYGKKLQKLKVTIGTPELRKDTEKAFEQITKYAQEIINQTNIGAVANAYITVKIENHSFTISRYRLSIKFYIAGDTRIIVQDEKNYSRSKLTYNIELKKYIWNKNYWYLKNFGFISLESFVVKVMDAFILHSNF